MKKEYLILAFWYLFSAVLTFQYVIMYTTHVIEQEDIAGGGGGLVIFVAAYMIFGTIYAPPINSVLARTLNFLSRKLFELKEIDYNKHIVIGSLVPAGLLFVLMALQFISLALSPNYLDSSSANFYQLTFTLVFPAVIALLYAIWNVIINLSVILFNKVRSKIK